MNLTQIDESHSDDHDVNNVQGEEAVGRMPARRGGCSLLSLSKTTARSQKKGQHT